jgi:hypothetical protein
MGGAQRQRPAEGPTLRTVYVMRGDKSADAGAPAVLQAVNVKIGFADGANAEVLEGLEPGDVVVTGLRAAATTTTATANPFGSPFGGPPRR